ncbi:MAG: DNA-binding NarL/FixJ family response regulator [Cellvibrionaceae bacterium]|jgi:DNA-binding NarL/FixJ family response regulator
MNNKASNKGIVLVVDDSPEILSMLNEALEQVGYTVLIALEGKQALTIAEKITPDIILLDAVMPNMDGFETCQHIKLNKQLDKVPVIFMTGLSDSDNIIKGLEAGGVDYLSKPIKPNELIARMKVHLNNARLAQSAQTALDTTGQQLFAITPQGSIKWATPLTQNLFEKGGIDQTWLDTQLSKQLKNWLSHDPLIGQYYTLEQTSTPLKVKLIDRKDDNETLLKLIDLKGPTAAERLKAALDITERESDVLYWIGQGKTNKDIGEILEMSPRTVNKHLEQIFKKLNVENRTAAASIAIHRLAGI